MTHTEFYAAFKKYTVAEHCITRNSVQYVLVEKKAGYRKICTIYLSIKIIQAQKTEDRKDVH